MEFLLNDILLVRLKRFGALIRWSYQLDKPYTEILKQDWNTRIGTILFWIILISILVVRSF